MRQAQMITDIFLGIISSEVISGSGEVEIPGFGRFYKKHFKGGTTLKGFDGKEHVTKPYDRVMFKPSKGIDYFNEKFNG